MEKFKQELIRICEENLFLLDGYSKVLNSVATNDEKKLKSEYYAFAAKALKITDALDALTLKLSLKIQNADKANDYAQVGSLSVLFEHCIEYRRIIEKYLSDNENSLRSTDGNILRNIKSNNDILIRKIIIFKSSL